MTRSSDDPNQSKDDPSQIKDDPSQTKDNPNQSKDDPNQLHDDPNQSEDGPKVIDPPALPERCLPKVFFYICVPFSVFLTLVMCNFWVFASFIYIYRLFVCHESLYFNAQLSYSGVSSQSVCF